MRMIDGRLPRRALCVQLLTEAVGWPNAPAAANGDSTAAEDAELRLQLTTLQLVSSETLGLAICIIMS